MGVLFVSEPCRVKVVRGSVYVLTASGEKVQVNPAAHDSIVIATRAASITTAALAALASMGVDVTVLGPRGHPACRLYPPFINKTVMTRAAQYRAMVDGRGLEAAKNIVEAKVRNQAAVLRYAAKSRRVDWPAVEAERLAAIADELREAGPDPLEVRDAEARAARVYWQALARLLPPEYGFAGRDHASPDPFNMALNYGYGILYARCERALVLAGLDPYGGFMHAPKSGKTTLVYDFIEQFRPVAVDKPLLFAAPRLEVYNGTLTRESRRAVATVVLEALARPHYHGSTKRPLDEIIMRKAWELAAYLRGSLGTYAGYRVRW